VRRRCPSCDRLAQEAEIEFDRLLRIMRLVARHPSYRRRVKQLVSRTPVDLWYEKDLGWSVVYELDDDATLGFAIAGPAEVDESSYVYRAYECKELEEGGSGPSPWPEGSREVSGAAT
jgi:hypothetical protein